MQLPDAASLQRTSEAAREVEDRLLRTPGIQSVTSVIGFSLLSVTQQTYSAFFFVTLKPWDERTQPNEQYTAILQNAGMELSKIKAGLAFSFPPPAIPGVGTSGGVTFMLEDRSGGEQQFLTDNLFKFMQAAQKRPEIAGIIPSYLPNVPQIFADVDRAKVMREGVEGPVTVTFDRLKMLATVIRDSIESARIASPAYSTTCPDAPSVPIWAIVPRIRSLAVQPSASVPW